MQPERLAETLAGVIRGLLDPMALRVKALEDVLDKDAARLEGYTAFLQRDLAAAVARIAELEARAPVPGPEGPSGPAGPAGRDGLDAKSLRELYRGRYAAGTAYAAGELVTEDGSTFIRLEDGEAPGRPGKSPGWQIVAMRGNPGKDARGDG